MRIQRTTAAIALLTFGIAVLSACALFSKKDKKASSNEVQSDSSTQLSAEEESDLEAIAEDDPEKAAKIERRKFPHPIIADAWHTNKLVMTKKIPDRKLLNNCRADLNIIGAQVSNDEAMVLAIQSLQETVAKQKEFYHWCFYYSVSNLDWGLENQTKRSLIEEQQAYFHRNMRGLFVLARSLDHVRQTRRYFYYIRRRYVELSQNYFGRTLDLIAPPVDVVTRPIGRPEPPRTKVAAPAAVDR